MHSGVQTLHVRARGPGEIRIECLTLTLSIETTIAVTATTLKPRVSRKPPALKRAIEKKCAEWREWRSLGYKWAADFDADSHDWERYGNLFDPLSDDEWARVWKHILNASGHEPSIDEVRVRNLVDDAALSSGWFAEFGELHISQADFRRFATEKQSFASKVQEFRRVLAEFFGEPPTDHTEPYDPWERDRPILAALDRLHAVLEARIAQDIEASSFMKGKDFPNAAQPELDRWRARLVLIWQQNGLPITNTKELRGFLLDVLQPYMLGQLTDRSARHFIARWLAGEIRDPGDSLVQRLRDK